MEYLIFYIFLVDKTVSLHVRQHPTRTDKFIFRKGIFLTFANQGITTQILLQLNELFVKQTKSQ